MNKDKSVVTVGTFDGVHRGHVAVVDEVLARARSLGARPLVITFDRHPLSLIAPDRAPGLITDPDRRDELLRELGAEVVRIPFTEEVRRLTAREWMARTVTDYGAVAMVLGYDNTFGSDGLGMTLRDFREIGADLGLDVTMAPMVQGCSSSAVRRALRDGDVGLAAEILGRWYELDGNVAHGRKIGRTIGAPTANLRTDPRLQLPACGVYAAIVRQEARGKRQESTSSRKGEGLDSPLLTLNMAAVNVGSNPTVSSAGKISVEAHLLDFDGDLYGKELRVQLVARLRDEKKFDRITDLRDQIATDASAARRLLSALMTDSAD